MATFGKCLRGNLDKHYPGWKTEDEDASQVVWYLDYLDVVGARVKKKEITNDQANQLAKAELQNLVAAKKRKREGITAAEQAEDAKKKQLEAKRQREIAEDYQREADSRRYDQMQAALVAQEKQERSRQVMEASAMFFNMGQRRYAPQTPIIYPQETNITIQQPSTYRFYDSRPYR